MSGSTLAKLGTGQDRYEQATAHLDPPFAVVDVAAFDSNARDLVRRAGGLPIRVVSKSLRCRYLVERALAQPGYRGIMCYSLAEALWLHSAGLSDDLLVAYPTADRGALRALAANATARQHITVTIDSAAHLDFIDATLGEGHPEIRVCLELDVSWRPLGDRAAVQIGTWRSPLREPAQAALVAEAILARPGFVLVGVLGYEGQIAGLGDSPPGNPVRAALVRAIQARSAAELRERRAETVRRIRALTTLEFVNGGGTGSLESTAADESVTELAAGSGLVGPTLFDAYRKFRPRLHVRAAGGPAAGAAHRHPVQRRLCGVGNRDTGPAAHAIPARWVAAVARRGRRRGADAGARRRGGRPPHRRPGLAAARQGRRTRRAPDRIPRDRGRRRGAKRADLSRGRTVLWMKRSRPARKRSRPR